MEAASATRELDHETLRAAELGFMQYLRRKGISESFIERHGEDLFGTAQKQYATWIAEGNTPTNAVGWLINCGWRRTQDLLDELRRHPQAVSVDEAVYLADAVTPGPEDQALDHDRCERLQRAMGFLSAKDRKLLELTYFEGFDVFTAGRKLGWTKSSAHRHHKAALERLRAILPDDLDALGAEIGLGAWVTLVGDAGRGWKLPGGVEAVLDGARESAAGALHRLAELWRKVSPAADPSNATATSGAARAAGVCGAAAVVCLASGVIGPGVGAVDSVVHHHAPAPKATSAPAPAPTYTTPVAAPSSSTTGESASTSSTQRSSTSAHSQKKSSARRVSTASTPSSNAAAPQTSAEPAQPEFGLESTSGSTATASPTTNSSSSSSESVSASRPQTSSTPTSTAPSTPSSSSAQPEFGM